MAESVGNPVLQRHRALLDEAVECYLEAEGEERRRVARSIVRAHAQHVAAVENPYLVEDSDNLKRIEQMSLKRVKYGRSEFCPKRCAGGLVMAHGFCTNGHDLSKPSR